MRGNGSSSSGRTVRSRLSPVIFLHLGANGTLAVCFEGLSSLSPSPHCADSKINSTMEDCHFLNLSSLTGRALQWRHPFQNRSVGGDIDGVAKQNLEMVQEAKVCSNQPVIDVCNDLLD